MPSDNPTYGYLLKLLSFGLYGPCTQSFSLGATLSERQWYKLLEEAEKQTLTGIIFPAISCLPESEMPSVSVLATWLAMANRDSTRYHEMSKVLARLVEIFESRGFHPVLQKGHAAARFYHKPELRACGDIDLWFPDKEREGADDLIRSMGIKVIHTPDNGSCYAVNGIETEHHSMLIEVHNPFHAGLLGKMCDTYPSQRVQLPAGVSVNVPSPIVELLMMNVHILKHCLGVGIGMRQFCDYSNAWRRLVTYGEGNVDLGRYINLCKRLGILQWTRVLHRFINRYIPVPDGDAVDSIPGYANDMAVERIFDLVCDGGNFGKFSPGRRAGRRRNRAQRKLHTMSAFINNRSFVSQLVPFEAFWTFSRLLLGQIH